jgi:ABC-type nitrate/sulfonate/bicarbonate transport system substrate-binding protein
MARPSDLFAGFCALMLAAASLAAAPHAAAQSRTTLSAVVIGVSVSIWPAIVADRKGFFMEEGLDFDLINSGSSARSLQQVAAGSAQIGSSSMVDSIRAIGGEALAMLQRVNQAGRGHDFKTLIDADKKLRRNDRDLDGTELHAFDLSWDRA